MIDSAGTGRQQDALGGEDPVDLRRYLSGLRRSWALMLAIVLAATGTAVGLSLAAQKTYKTTATLVLLESAGNVSEEGVARRLATVVALITTPDVLAQAARRVGGTTAGALRDQVNASADPGASIVNISATAPSADRAARVTNAVAEVFLEREQGRAVTRVRSARDRLSRELAQLPNTPTGRAEAQALREQLSALAVTEATTQAEFEIAEPAEAGRADVSPRPLRNGLLALFASIFLAVLVALGRDQLVPRVSGPRELSRLTGLPVLAKIPPHRFSLGRRPRAISGAEHASYEILQSLLTAHMPAPTQKMVLVTSALTGEGKTRVVAGLGRALAHEGHDTLLISADLRLPKLHEHFGLPLYSGVAELLTDHLVDNQLSDAETIEQLLTESLTGTHGTGKLRMLSAGKAEVNPSRLLSPELIGRLFQEINRLDFAYVLVDSPPLLGLPDAQTLAHWCDAVIVVARPDRMGLETASDLRDVLVRTETPKLGLVVTNVRQSDVGAYYYGGGFDFNETG